MMGRNIIRKNSKGVTLIEIMMVMAVMSVLFIGLFTLINKVSHGVFSLDSSLDLNDQASEAMYWIGNDFRNAKASSMGNNGYNAGFESPLSPNISPDGWEDLAANGTIKTGPEVGKTMSGFFALGLPLGTTYYSKISTTTYNGDYIVSTWVNNENGGYGECWLMDNNGVDFTPAIFISSTTTGGSSWTHVTASVVSLTDLYICLSLRTQQR